MSLKVLKSIASFLSEAGIPYMVTGGQAVLQYGIPRFTKDIDFLIALTPWELCKVLKYVEASFRVLHSDWEKFFQNMKVLHMEHLETDISVDLIFIDSNIGFDRDAIEKASHITVEGMAINYIVPEYLIVRKIIRGKTLDLEDIEGILAIQGDKIDRKWVKKVVNDLSRQTGNVKWLNRWEELQKHSDI
jgi:hypothetical protein